MQYSQLLRFISKAALEYVIKRLALLPNSIETHQWSVEILSVSVLVDRWPRRTDNDRKIARGCIASA